MQADAYRRARRLLSSRGDYVIARVLGFVQSLLIVALLGVIALFVALVSSRGEARFPASARGLLPAWAVNRVTGEDQQYLLFDDTGFFPLIADNLRSRNPVHSGGASILGWAARNFPALQYNRSALTTLMAAGAICIVLISLLAIWRRRVVAAVATDVATSLRRQIHRQMYRLGQSSLPTEGIGPVVNLWTREVNDVRDGLIADVDLTPRIQVLAVGLLVIALLVSPVLTTFLASLGLLVWLTARVLNRDARQATESALRDASVQLCLLHEDLGLLRTVRTYGVGEYDRQRFDEHLDRYLRADTQRILTSAPINPSTGLLYGGALTIALGLLGYNVVVNDQISIATMLILLVSLAGLAYPISEWVRLGKAVRQASRSIRGIYEFLDRRPELHQNVGAHFLNALKDQITFENVEIESRSGRRLLDGVSVEVPAGSRTAIMGQDDDAKLALVCLIPRLLDPRSGRILIDGHDLRDVTFESVRAQVATVLQADLVFTDSVLVNIGLGDSMNTLPRIIEAAKLAHAHHFIQDLPHGYDTTIGPLGHYLKPDEQFRIALARAYLHDPSILIVEEPKTPIDDDTRHFLDDTLSRLSIGRTLIVVPHRLATFRSCDHVIVLQNGRVEDSGSPIQLQAESKLLRHLLYIEFNEFASGEMEAGQMPYGEAVPKAAS
jgi:ABC-type multidrug transport system fused ATPase/permease subunit